MSISQHFWLVLLLGLFGPSPEVVSGFRTVKLGVRLSGLSRACSHIFSLIQILIIYIEREGVYVVWYIMYSCWCEDVAKLLGSSWHCPCICPLPKRALKPMKPLTPHSTPNVKLPFAGSQGPHVDVVHGGVDVEIPANRVAPCVEFSDPIGRGSIARVDPESPSPKAPDPGK